MIPEVAADLFIGQAGRLFPLDNAEILIIRTICWFNHWQGTFLGYNHIKMVEANIL